MRCARRRLSAAALLATGCWLLAADVAGAATGTIAQSLDLKVAPGSALRAGFDVAMPGKHPAAAVHVYSGSVIVSLRCPDRSAPSVTISLSDQAFDIAAASPAWYPSGDQSDSGTYQGSLMLPTNLCGGATASSTRAVFSADFSSTDTHDTVRVRMHLADGKNGGGWSPSVSVTPSAAQPPTTPAPSSAGPGLASGTQAASTAGSPAHAAGHSLGHQAGAPSATQSPASVQPPEVTGYPPVHPGPPSPAVVQPAPGTVGSPAPLIPSPFNWVIGGLALGLIVFNLSGLSWAAYWRSRARRPL